MLNLSSPLWADSLPRVAVRPEGRRVLSPRFSSAFRPSTEQPGEGIDPPSYHAVPTTFLGVPSCSWALTWLASPAKLSGHITIISRWMLGSPAVLFNPRWLHH